MLGDVAVKVNMVVISGEGGKGAGRYYCKNPDVLRPVIHYIGYVRRTCKGHGIVCLWIFLLKARQEVTSGMIFTDRLCRLQFFQRM